MSYLETVLTYDRPSEAEVDKAFLESHGITVHLLNANTARNELGAPFFIRLQVMAEDRDEALAILREANPTRFGSAERVAEIEKDMKRSVLWFLGGALPCGAITYLMVQAPAWEGPVVRLDSVEPPDMRPLAALCGAFLGGLAVTWVRHIFTKKKRSGGTAPTSPPSP